MSEGMGLTFGCGWVDSDTGVVVAPDGTQVALAESTRASMRSDDVRERAAAREQEAVRSARADLLSSQAAAGVMTPSSHAEVLQRFSLRADFEDRRAARQAERELDQVRFGEVDLVQRPAPGLRSEKLALQRRQRERREAMTPEQRELRELRGEVTHLRALIHARGGYDPDPVVGYRSVRGGEVEVRASQVNHHRDGGPITSIR
jgi:hypothetical protein